MEQQPRMAQESDRSERQRRRYISRVQERAENRMNKILVAYDIARWAVAYSLTTERNKYAKAAKRNAVLRDIRKDKMFQKM